jgi:cyclin B
MAAQVAHYAGYLVELAMLDYSMLKYCYSMVAAAAVLAANKGLGAAPAFPHALLRHSGYTEATLLPAAITLAGLHAKAPEASLKTVYKKHSHTSHGKARAPPAPLNLGHMPLQALRNYANRSAASIAMRKWQ